MGVSLTLKHVKALGAGRYEYRRRVPESVKAHLGKSEFKRVFTATSAAALAKEHARISLEFDRAVAGAMPQDSARLTPREAAKAAKEEAARLLEGVHGADDEDEARDILAHAMELQGVSPALWKAVVKPGEELPRATLEDARKLYEREHLRGGEGSEVREAAARVERVFRHLVAALGKDALSRPLDKLLREDARKLRDHLLRVPKKGGGTLVRVSQISGRSFR